MPAGKDVRFASPPSVGEFDQFRGPMLLQIAAGYGITYEALTSDLSQANYSSARMGHLEFSRNIDCWQKQILIAQMGRFGVGLSKQPRLSVMTLLMFGCTGHQQDARIDRPARGWRNHRSGARWAYEPVGSYPSFWL